MTHEETPMSFRCSFAALYPDKAQRNGGLR